MRADDTQRCEEQHVETSDLRKAGLKVTLPRIKILEILGTATPRHMSAEDIYKHLLESHEDIGLATVYRVLTQFEARLKYELKDHSMILYGYCSRPDCPARKGRN